MTEVRPNTGPPPLFYCKPINEKGEPCHAPDCDRRSGCVLELKRQQHITNGKIVNHHNHFRCTITCGFCDKRRHYEDKCHIKRRRSDKLRRHEAEQQKTQLLPEPPRMKTREVRVEAKGVARMEPLTITPRGARQRPLLFLLLSRLTLRYAHREITPPRRSVTPRRGNWPGWPNRSWLQGPM